VSDLPAVPSIPEAVDPFDRQQVARVVPRPPVLTSERAGWRDLNVAHFSNQQPGEVPEHVVSTHHMLVVMDFPGAVAAERGLDTRTAARLYRRSDVVMVPVGCPQWARWHASCDVTTLILDPHLIDRVAPDLELTPDFGAIDRGLYHLCRALRAELLSEGASGPLFVEGVAQAVATRVAARFGTRRLELPTGGLSAAALREVRDYVEAYLHEKIALADLARVAHLSPHHFSRLFKQATGCTPYKYVLRSRVERARQLLRSGMAIAEVVTVAGFSSHSQLTRHCQRLLGATPSELRRARIDKI